MDRHFFLEHCVSTRPGLVQWADRFLALMRVIIGGRSFAYLKGESQTARYQIQNPPIPYSPWVVTTLKIVLFVPALLFAMLGLIVKAVGGKLDPSSVVPYQNWETPKEIDIRKPPEGLEKEFWVETAVHPKSYIRDNVFQPLGLKDSPSKTRFDRFLYANRSQVENHIVSVAAEGKKLEDPIALLSVGNDVLTAYIVLGKLFGYGFQDVTLHTINADQQEIGRLTSWVQSRSTFKIISYDNLLVLPGDLYDCAWVLNSSETIDKQLSILGKLKDRGRLVITSDLEEYSLGSEQALVSKKSFKTPEEVPKDPEEQFDMRGFIPVGDGDIATYVCSYASSFVTLPEVGPIFIRCHNFKQAIPMLIGTIIGLVQRSALRAAIADKKLSPLAIVIDFPDMPEEIQKVVTSLTCSYSKYICRTQPLRPPQSYHIALSEVEEDDVESSRIIKTLEERGIACVVGKEERWIMCQRKGIAKNDSDLYSIASKESRFVSKIRQIASSYLFYG